MKAVDPRWFIQNFSSRTSVKDVDELLELRSTKRRLLIEAIAALRLPVEVRGSWLYGDFHLTVDGYSFSDLDLVLTRHADMDNIRRLVSEVLSDLGYSHIKLGLHPFDTFQSLSLDNRSFLSIAEVYISHRTMSLEQYQCCVCKVWLAALRTGAEQRYCDVAVRLDGVFADAALVKLGLADSFEVGQLLDECTRMAAGNPTLECLAKWSRTEPGSRELDCYLRLLETRHGLDPWLKAYVKSKIAQAV